MRSRTRLHRIWLRLTSRAHSVNRSLRHVRSRRDRARRLPERGAAVVELLLLGVPLCVLAMVLASKLAATSSARMQAQWTASQRAQLETREPCGMDLLLTAGPVALIAIAILAAAYWWLDPTPPRSVRLATGPAQAETVVVVNAAFTANLDDEALARIFLRQVKTFPDGSAAAPWRDL